MTYLLDSVLPFYGDLFTVHEKLVVLLRRVIFTKSSLAEFQAYKVHTRSEATVVT